MKINLKITNWYTENKRDLPWRNTVNPYYIWLSEIILQQTRVEQGLPYYEKFVDLFPTIFDLAHAEEQEVLKIWQGLGYYSRARNLHETAKYIVNTFNGVFPNTYQEILKLKGVGTYTAAAIASFCYNEKVAVVDGNVFRVLSRIFGIDLDIQKSSSKKYFKIFAEELIEDFDPALFNQAIMEFGALQCLPKNPNCTNCVFADSCVAFNLNKIALFPVNNKKVKITNRYFNYVLIKNEKRNAIYLQQRVEQDIWKNLFEFYLIESNEVLSYSEVSVRVGEELNLKENFNLSLVDSADVTHKLSHQNLYIRFYILETTENLKNMIPLNTIEAYPFPIVLHNFLKNIVL